MYIINPFRQKGMAAANLSSTHPPINERIRILRSMAGASYLDYDKAYKSVHGGSRDVITGPDLAAAGVVTLRAPAVEEKEPDERARARETSDMLWRMNNYQTVDCKCGTRFRIPPTFKGSAVKCPHCGLVYQLKR